MKYHKLGVHVRREGTPAAETVVRCQTLREADSLTGLLNAYETALESERSISHELRVRLAFIPKSMGGDA